MTITISNLTVAASAPAGTAVGVLTARDPSGMIPCNFILSKSSSGYLAVFSNNLITVWSGSTAPGYYPVRVRAVGIKTRFSGSATFNVAVIAPSLPTPTGVTFVTKTTSLSDNSPAGTAIATFSVSMSDGSAFAGTLGASPASTVAISGSTHLVLARGLASADDGSQQWAVSATQNGVTVSSSITVQVTRATPPPPPPPPPAPPPSPSITVNGSSNAVVAPGASIAAAVASGPANPTDWVAIYAAGAPDVPLTTLGWDYLSGTQTAPSTGVSAATITMTAPSINGSYGARFYLNNLYTPVLARDTFAVQGVATPTAITLSPASVTYTGQCARR
jgi:hypothetical protein